MIEAILAIVNQFGSWIISVLPQSPFQNQVLPTLVGMQEGLGWLNWFLPFSSCLGIFSLWLVCVGIYYGYKVVLGWLFQ